MLLLWTDLVLSPPRWQRSNRARHLKEQESRGEGRDSSIDSDVDTHRTNIQGTTDPHSRMCRAGAIHSRVCVATDRLTLVGIYGWIVFVASLLVVFRKSGGSVCSHTQRGFCIRVVVVVDPD